jgi:hypothetical protein
VVEGSAPFQNNKLLHPWVIKHPEDPEIFLNKSKDYAYEVKDGKEVEEDAENERGFSKIVMKMTKCTKIGNLLLHTESNCAKTVQFFNQSFYYC